MEISINTKSNILQFEFKALKIQIERTITETLEISTRNVVQFELVKFKWSVFQFERLNLYSTFYNSK